MVLKLILATLALQAYIEAQPVPGTDEYFCGGPCDLTPVSPGYRFVGPRTR